MKTIITALLIILCLNQAGYGQSLKGNVNSSDMVNLSLGFANVNVYKNGVLVANVLTDESGNFNVKLDTGVYECEIIYAGYSKTKKEIRVTKDEKADFAMTEDKTSKFSAMEMRSYAAPAARTNVNLTNAVVATNMWGEETGKKADTAAYGKLTAGEINDFAKWNMWTDLTDGELKASEKYWNFAPEYRYVLQITDQDGLPLTNARAELIDKGRVLFTGVSDNTGKAELWGRLKPDSTFKISDASIVVTYKGEAKTVNRAKKFKRGINTVEFSTTCDQSQNVDIAIVVDATSSMQDEIDYLKYDLNDVVFKSKEISSVLNFRFANIFYRDKGDTYITESQDFTSVLSESVGYTNRHNSSGGGDYEESVEVALDSAINRLSWRTDTRAKILFLVLDAPPHNTIAIQNKMRELCENAAEKGIRIVPVTGSGTDKNSEYLMRCIALATNGTYTFLTNHSAIGYSHIKPSTDNYTVEVLNDLLVRIIKSYTYMPDCQQYVTDLGVNLPDSQIVVPSDIDSSLAGTDVIDSLKTGLPDDTTEIQWSYYPNPTDGIIHIVSNKAIKELYISDLSGKALQVISNIEPGVEVTADLSAYASGIYLIRYAVGKQWISGKIALRRNY